MWVDGGAGRRGDGYPGGDELRRAGSLVAGKNEASWRKEYRYKGFCKYFGNHRIGH